MRCPPKDQGRDEVLQMRLFIVMRAKRWEQALAVCARLRAYRVRSATTGYIHGAFCLHEMGRTLEAKQLLLNGPASLFGEPTYYYNLGCYDAVLGNLDEAAQHFETSFRMDRKVPRNRQVRPRFEVRSRITGQMTVDESAAARVKRSSRCNFVRGVEVGASVAVWQHGRQAFCFCQGWRDGDRELPWTADTMVLVWSATKGLASACLLHALEHAGLDLSTRMAEFWPEFAQNGKESITVGEVVSHRAGLSALTDKSVAKFVITRPSIRAIEGQAPLWDDRGEHGYSPRIYGYIADESVRKLAGIPLGHYWRKNFGDPMELDLWIGLPESLHHRAALMIAARAGCGDVEDDFSQAMATPGSLTREKHSRHPQARFHPRR